MTSAVRVFRRAQHRVDFTLNLRLAQTFKIHPNAVKLSGVVVDQAWKVTPCQ